MNMKKLCGSNRLKFKDDQGNMPLHCLSLYPAGVRGVDEGARGPPQRALLAVRLQTGPGRGALEGDAAAARRTVAVRGRGTIPSFFPATVYASISSFISRQFDPSGLYFTSRSANSKLVPRKYCRQTVWPLSPLPIPRTIDMGDLWIFS